MTQSSHMDLFWMGRMERCMELGADIIDHAVADLESNPDKYFLIETVRFLEFYLDKYPEKKPIVKKLMQNGQLEVGAAYVDRLENHHDGESLVRNAVYGKKMLNELVGLDSEVAAHPDLPGLGEQTPQIYSKCNVKYYTFARGYKDGARFIWSALNGKDSIVAYNYPVHYSYYDYHKVFDNLDKIRNAISDENPLICFSAGDLGYYGTFIRPDDVRENNDSIVEKLKTEYPDIDIEYSSVDKALNSMKSCDLPIYSGECPSKWGTYGSATNVESFQQDKRLSALLIDAEKLVAFCGLLHISTEKFAMDYPFCLMQKPHMLRDYYDSKIRPRSISEWIEFAWRLQIITQDHNYGGIDGVCSAFDRKIYKKIGIEIAENIIEYCMEQIKLSVKGSWDKLAINLWNWDITQKIYLDGFDAAGKVEDSNGNIYSTGSDEKGIYFQPVIKALSYETYRVLPDSESDTEIEEYVHQETSKVILSNSHYNIVFDRAVNGIVSIYDKEMGNELLGDSPVGIFKLLEDNSNDVHEVNYDKPLIDSTLGKNAEVETGYDYQAAWLIWTTQIGDSKAQVKVELNNVKKEFSIIPQIFWVGCDNSQLRFTFGINPVFTDLYYGVPYGIQKYGNYMYGSEPTNPSDEISMPLFHEYREIQGWFGAQADRAGISICSNQSAIAFRNNNEIEMVLIRDVVSCGDGDVMMDNHGKRTFWFIGTSFKDDDLVYNDKYYKESLAASHPVPVCDGKQSEAGTLDGHGEVLQVTGGILNVLQKVDEKYYARIFSASKEAPVISVCMGEESLKLQHCNLLNEMIDEDSVMKFGDIKTVSFK